MRPREILAIIADKSSEPDIIRSLIDEVERERENAHTELATLAEKRTEGLLDNNLAVLAKLDQSAQQNYTIIEQAELVLPKLQGALADALSRDAEAARRAKYDAAQEAAKKARASLKRYPTLAKEIVSILKQVAQADILVAEANEDLPTGRDELVGVEQTVRGLPAIPQKFLGERLSEPEWFYAGNGWEGTRVERRDYGAIKVDADGIHGVLDTKYSPHDPNFGRGEYGPTYPVVRRRTLVREILPGQSAFVPMPLAAQITLPNFAPGTPSVWTPTGVHPQLALPKQNETAILNAVEECETRWNAPPVDPRGESVPERQTKLLDPDEVSELELTALSVGI